MDKLYTDIVETDEIDRIYDTLFPRGEGHVNRHRVRWALDQVARRAFQAGKSYALMGLMTVNDVAEHFGVSERRARALIVNRHERFGVGMRAGNVWLVHRDELESLKPDERFKAD